MPNGAVTVFNEQGKLLQTGFYLQGKEDGHWEFYNEDGQLNYSGYYKNGERVGEWFEYDRKGRKKPWKYK